MSAISAVQFSWILATNVTRCSFGAGEPLLGRLCYRQFATDAQGRSSNRGNFWHWCSKAQLKRDRGLPVYCLWLDMIGIDWRFTVYLCLWNDQNLRHGTPDMVYETKYLIRVDSCQHVLSILFSICYAWFVVCMFCEEHIWPVLKQWGVAPICVLCLELCLPRWS